MAKVYNWIWIAGALLQLCCNRSRSSDDHIVFWCSNNNQEIVFCTGLAESWNKNASGYPISLQPIPEGQSSEEVILAAVVGKTTPDIYANMWQGNVEMYARSKVLIALDTLPGFIDFIRERCDAATIREITSSDGHIYQIPWKVNPIMTIYNVNLFRSNHISELPVTYSSYIKAAETFKQDYASTGGVKRFGYTEVKPIWYQRLFNFYTLYLAASDGAPLVTGNKAAFNNRYAVEVFAFLQSLYRHEYFSKESNASSTDPFVIQNIASKWTGPWEISYLNNIPGKGFDFNYYPPIVPDDHRGSVYTYADPKNIVLFSTCKHPREAWDFLKTLVDKPGDLKLLNTTGQLPKRKDLDKDPYFTKYFADNPMMVAFAKEIPYAKGVDNCDVIVEVLDIISQEYQACVLYGTKTPEQAVADAEKAVNTLLASSTE